MQVGGGSLIAQTIAADPHKTKIAPPRAGLIDVAPCRFAAGPRWPKPPQKMRP